jgi:hypothetical protein
MTSTISFMTSIKYEKVIVVWQDINSCNSAWNTEQDLKDLKPAMCTTIGYLYEDNDNYIKTFATYSIDPTTEELDVGDAIVIPKGVIIKLQKLES